MKDIVEWVQKLLPWLTGLPFAPKVAVSAIIVASGIFLLLLIWSAPPKKVDAASSVAGAFGTMDRATVRFGLTLGWELGRFEFVDGSSFPEARAAAPSIRQEIGQLLDQDHFSTAVNALDSRQLITAVLTHYGTTDVQKHGAILLGIAAMRASIIGASKNEEHNAEMRNLVFSAIKEIDARVLPRKEEFFTALMTRPPHNVSEALAFLDELAGASK